VLLAACASVAVTQTGSNASAEPTAMQSGTKSAETATPPASGAPSALPPFKARPLADGSYRDLQGNRLVPPAAMFGAKIEACPPLVAKHLGLDPSKCSILAEVMPGCPADQAGLEPHDIIVAVAGLSDASEQNLRQAIRMAKPGDALLVTVQRGSKKEQATVTLAPWHPDHMVRHLKPEHFQTLPTLPPPVPATTAQVQALEQRVAALEGQVAELRRLVQQSSGR